MSTARSARPSVEEFAPVLSRCRCSRSACDPAQEVSTNLDQETCSAGEEKHVEFTNVAPITYTLPPAPKVECGITYAILGGSAVTFSGGELSIKGDGQPVSTSLVRTTAGTGRLVWNGLHWVHIGGG